jgi:hypothetical protein
MLQKYAIGKQFAGNGKNTETSKGKKKGIMIELKQKRNNKRKMIGRQQGMQDERMKEGRKKSWIERKNKNKNNE